MKLRLLTALLLGGVALHAAWIYQQYPGDAQVSFSHNPGATTGQLNQAKSALQAVKGVKSIYIQDDSAFVVKDPAIPWRQVWDTLVSTLDGLDSATQQT